MKKIELEIIALSHSITQSHSYAVVLGELKGQRRLPIVIGAFEAQAIAVAIENMAPSRPLTHDLMKNAFESFEIALSEIVISDLVDGIFYAKLICQHGDQTLEIDSRTSDALALAVRFNCPIYTYESILETAGIILEEPEKEGEAAAPKKPRRKKATAKKKEADLSDLSVYTVKELDSMLQSALEQEEYEKAIALRDELKKRKEGS